MIAYELWETESGNLMGSYPTKDQALSALAAAVESHGGRYAETVALVCERSSG
ncbi:MAG: hypothetical protein HW416_2566, partial [Chloroflexi bacterium]|nr:hypothetical protein [Chloroflexota bacterium]